MLFRLLAAFSALAAASGITVKDCGGTGAKFTVDSLSVEPVAPAPGDTFYLHLGYTVPAGLVVTDGTAEYDVTLNFIPFAPSTEPLCQDIPCPLGPGSYTNTTASTWPSGVSGTLVSKMKWLDADGSQLLCIQISGALEDEGMCATNHTLALPAPEPVLLLAPPPARAPAPPARRSLRGATDEL